MIQCRYPFPPLYDKKKKHFVRYFTGVARWSNCRGRGIVFHAAIKENSTEKVNVDSQYVNKQNRTTVTPITEVTTSTPKSRHGRESWCQKDRGCNNILLTEVEWTHMYSQDSENSLRKRNITCSPRYRKLNV